MKKNKFGREYFDNYANNGPYSEELYLEFHKSVAKAIKMKINPKKLLDVGCARGFLVDALREQKIDALGIDISEYAITNALANSRDYCRVQSALEPFNEKYDLITCIEVAEHLPIEEAKRAIANICRHADAVLFSSSSNFIHPDHTHINQHLPEYWIDLFARSGFEVDKNFDASFISKDAMKFNRKNLMITFLMPGLDASGGVRVVLEHCNNLAQRGHIINIVSLSGGQVNWFDLDSSIRIIKSNPDSCIKDLPNSDVLVANLCNTTPLVYNAPQEAGQKYYFIQGLDPIIFPEMKFMYAYQLPLVKFTVSNWLKNTIEESTNDRVELIHSGINKKIFYPDQTIRQRYEKKNIRIGMIYSEISFKGAQDGLESIALIKKSYDNIKIILMGIQPKPLKINCDEYWHNPQQAQINEFYNSCDIFISSSWLEGFGLPVLEAMACKCPVACTDQKGNREFAINEETALVSHPQQVELLANNIKRLIEDKKFREIIRENAYKKAEAFTWEEAAQRLISFFIRTYKLKKSTDGLVEKLNREIMQLYDENRSLQAQINNIKKSTSWKITVLVRVVGDLIKKFKHGKND